MTTDEMVTRIETTFFVYRRSQVTSGLLRFVIMALERQHEWEGWDATSNQTTFQLSIFTQNEKLCGPKENSVYVFIINRVK